MNRATGSTSNNASLRLMKISSRTGFTSQAYAPEKAATRPEQIKAPTNLNRCGFR